MHESPISVFYDEKYGRLGNSRNSLPSQYVCIMCLNRVGIQAFLFLLNKIIFESYLNHFKK